MRIFTKLRPYLSRGWDAAELVADSVGGWPTLLAIATGVATAVWGFIKDWGPLSLIPAFYIAALALLVFDYGELLVRRHRRADRDRIALAARLEQLTEEGTTLKNDIALGLVSYMPLYSHWVDRTLEAMLDEGFEEYYGFKTLEIDRQLEKLRRITMRHSQVHKIKARDVVEYRKQHKNEGTA